MNISQYWLGKDIRDMVPGISEQNALMLDIACGSKPVLSGTPGFVKDAFYMDGTPICPEKGVVYPCFAPWYTGTPIPETFHRIEDGYSQGAAKAAISWALALHGGTIGSRNVLDGFSVEMNYQGTSLQIHFPICQAVHTNGAIVVPVADTFRNDEAWGQGAIPAYVEQHVRFLLWCYENFHNPAPPKAYVARIVGNLPTDVTLYTVYASSDKDTKAAERVLRAFTAAQNNGKDPLTNLRTIEETPWQERKEAELEGVYRIDDPNLYELTRQYLAARSERKTLEAQDKELKAEADAIAVALGSLTGGDARDGVLRADGTVYRVTHIRSRKSTPGITAALIYQFAPEKASQVIGDVEGKVSVSIDVI